MVLLAGHTKYVAMYAGSYCCRCRCRCTAVLLPLLPPPVLPLLQ
jgi:hypothetical protein